MKRNRKPVNKGRHQPGKHHALDMSLREKQELHRQYMRTLNGYYAEQIKADLVRNGENIPEPWSNLRAKVQSRKMPEGTADYLTSNFDYKSAHTNNDLDMVTFVDRTNGEPYAANGGFDVTEPADRLGLAGVIGAGKAFNQLPDMIDNIDKLVEEGIVPSGITATGDSKGGIDSHGLYLGSKHVKAVEKSNAPGLGGVFGQIGDWLGFHDNEPLDPNVSTIESAGYGVIAGFGKDVENDEFVIDGLNSHFSKNNIPHLQSLMKGERAGDFKNIPSHEKAERQLRTARGQMKRGAKERRDIAVKLDRAKREYREHQKRLGDTDGMPHPDIPQNPVPDELRPASTRAGLPYGVVGLEPALWRSNRPAAGQSQTVQRQRDMLMAEDRKIAARERQLVQRREEMCGRRGYDGFKVEQELIKARQARIANEKKMQAVQNFLDHEQQVIHAYRSAQANKNQSPEQPPKQPEKSWAELANDVPGRGNANQAGDKTVGKQGTEKPGATAQLADDLVTPPSAGRVDVPVPDLMTNTRTDAEERAVQRAEQDIADRQARAVQNLATAGVPEPDKAAGKQLQQALNKDIRGDTASNDADISDAGQNPNDSLGGAEETLGSDDAPEETGLLKEDGDVGPVTQKAIRDHIDSHGPENSADRLQDNGAFAAGGNNNDSSSNDWDRDIGGSYTPVDRSQYSRNDRASGMGWSPSQKTNTNSQSHNDFGSWGGWL